MANDSSEYVRSELFDALMAKVEQDNYPSSTMLDTIESLLTPDEIRIYADALLERIREDNYPSISMIRRVQSLA